MTTPKGQQQAADIDEQIAEMDSEGIDRKLPSPVSIALVAASAAYAFFHLLVLNAWPIDEWIYRILHVNLGAVLAFVGIKAWKREWALPTAIADLALIAGALGCSAYVAINYDRLLMSAGVIATTGDLICGVVGTLVVLEFTRRTSGLILPLIALIFVSYAFAGQWLPGILRNSGYDPANFFSFLYSQDAIFGVTVAASSRYIIIFVAFAAFLQSSGAGDYFMRVAMSLFGGLRGGPGKVSVVSSLLFGSVSGSAVANVVATGTFTIPMMRRVGYPKESAGAIEAAASSGGQLAPPVMGAGAFIMAEITGIPYSKIILAALLPCLLYYVSIFLTVDRQASRLGLTGIPRKELPKLRDLGRDVFLLLPLVVLLYLVLSGYSIVAAGTWGLVSSLLVLMCRELELRSWALGMPLALFVLLPLSGISVNEVGMTATLAGVITLAAYAVIQGKAALLPGTFRTIMRSIVDGLAESARKSLPLIGVMACAGVVVGVLGITGLGGRFSALLLTVAGNSQGLAFVFSMAISIILGMGMPTTAAYAIAAAVVAPSLQQMGVTPLAAHMFVFYCAVISAITPPVAIAGFAGAAIAGANPFATSVRAMRFGLAAFILPFMFYASPEILLQGSWLTAGFTFSLALLAVFFISAAGEGYLFGPIGPLARALSAVCALLLLWANLPSDIAGLVLAVGLVAWTRIKAPRPAHLTAASSKEIH